MSVVEHLAGPGQEGRDVLPEPRGSIADHPQSDLLCGNHTRLCDLCEGVTALCLVLHLMPTHQRAKALIIEQRKPQARGVSPRAMPRSASGPTAPPPTLALPGAVGTRGPGGPLEAQSHHRTAQTAGCHRLHTTRHFLT